MKIRFFEDEVRAEMEKAKKRAVSREKKEDLEQQKFVEWARANFELVWHTPNTRKGIRAGVYWKAMGVLAGVPDIIVVHRRMNMAIEFKRPKEKPSEAQKVVMGAMHRNGWHVIVAYSAEEARKFVTEIISDPRNW